MEKLAKIKQKPVSLEQGEKLAKELKAVKYVECSALTQVSIMVHFNKFVLFFFHFTNISHQYFEYVIPWRTE